MTPARVGSREGELLAIARALVSPDSYPSIEGALASAVAVTKLGPTAMRVLEDTLAKGVVKTFARLGGGRPALRLGAAESATAPSVGAAKLTRVFEARAAPAISFGAYTFELLRWLANTPLRSKADGAPFEATPETVGDELCAYLALRLVEGQRMERRVAESPGLRCDLTWLGFARPLARHGHNVSLPTLERLLETEERRVVLECLAVDLARRWRDGAVWNDVDVLDAEHATLIGTVERAVVDRFLDAVDRKQRWDLATFLIEAGARALPRGASVRDVAARAVPRVGADGTLRLRTESRRKAGALFHALVRLGKTRDALALVRFIDDEYESAQAVLTSWEHIGRDAFARAEGVLSALDSLDGPGDAS
jgi:hypothetical protein